MFETRDGWASWTRADAGLPDGLVIAMAVDPVIPDRVYLSMWPPYAAPARPMMYVRIGGGAWVPLAIPPLPANPLEPIQIAPTVAACGQPQSYPTVFAGTLMSFDGGQTWSRIGQASGLLNDPRRVAFDRTDPCAVYAVGDGGYYKSADGGRHWALSVPSQVTAVSRLFQDVLNPSVFYASSIFSAAVRVSTARRPGRSCRPRG